MNDYEIAFKVAKEFFEKRGNKSFESSTFFKYLEQQMSYKQTKIK